MFKLALRVGIEAISNDIGLLPWPDPNGRDQIIGKRCHWKGWFETFFTRLMSSWFCHGLILQGKLRFDMEKDLSLKQNVDVSFDDLSRVKMRLRFAGRPHFVLYGFSFFFLLVAMCCHAFAGDESLKIKKIVAAHEKALKIYNNKGSVFNAAYIMQNSGVDDIIDKKPDKMDDAKYILILNDYGFFHSKHYEEAFIDKSIKVLQRVITIAPNRTPAYLNLGDALFKKLKFIFSYAEKLKTSKDIEACYQYYKNHSKSKFDRVENFLNHNISKDTSDSICDYIVTQMNNGCYEQILSMPGGKDDPSLCDINNDGKNEYISFDLDGFFMKNNDSDTLINVEGFSDTNKTLFKYIEDNGETLGYQDMAVVPYKDGVYYAWCNSAVSSFGPYILSVEKLESGHNEMVCIFKTDHKKQIDVCKDKKLYEYIIRNKKLNYIAFKKQYSIVLGFLPKEGIDCKPFKFNNKLYFEVKSEGSFWPYYQIWELKNGKIDILFSYKYTVVHKAVFTKTPDKINKEK